MSKSSKKTVCFFGIYDPDYARNRVLIKGFKENGYEITECHVDPRETRGILKYWRLYKRYSALRLHHFDYVIVAYPGHTVVWLARLLFGRDIIFDAFLSLYDSNAFDRKVYKPKSVRGRRDWLIDWSACKLARRVLLDTNQHVEYFVKTFYVPREKCIRVFIGADDTVFYPRKETVQKNTEYIVHFHGNFIPLQGVQYIIGAAALLQDEQIRFRIIGAGGALYEMIKNSAQNKGLTNVDFVGLVPFKKVPEYIHEADICLAIFGDTKKAQRVIPNKIYEYIAMGKPSITADTPAIRELFIKDKNVILCKPASGANLAEKILLLKNNNVLQERIARGGYELFDAKLRPATLVNQLLTELNV